MTRRSLFLATAAILVSVVAIFIGWKVGRRHRAPEAAETTDASAPETVEGITAPYEVFFPGPGGRLYREQRELPVESDLRSHLERLLGELLEGPVSEELYPALPSEITVDWVHINDAGLVYVDLTYAGEGEFPSWGSGEEMLAVFSVVNTILASSPEIESVVLLRNGRQQPTFAGHLDTSRPLLANNQLVASR